MSLCSVVNAAVTLSRVNLLRVSKRVLAGLARPLLLVVATACKQAREDGNSRRRV